MAVFVVLFALGLVLLLGGLLHDGGLDGHLDALSGVLPDALPETPLTTPALGAALAALGLGGALATRTGAGALAAAGAGLLAAVVVGGLATWLTAVVIGAPAVPVRSEQLLGVFGTVVTPIPAGGLGEVVVRLGGAPHKLAAALSDDEWGDPREERERRPVPAGSSVYVLALRSATCVVVARTPVL